MMDVSQYDLVLKSYDIGQDHKEAAMYSIFSSGTRPYVDSCGFSTIVTEAFPIGAYSTENKNLTFPEAKLLFSFVQSNFTPEKPGSAPFSYAVNLQTKSVFDSGDCGVFPVETSFKWLESKRDYFAIFTCLESFKKSPALNSCPFSLENRDKGTIKFHFEMIRNRSIETEGTQILFGTSN